MHPAELRLQLQKEIDLFYEGGQKDPMPVLACLKEAAAAGLTFPTRLPAHGDTDSPAGWLRAYKEDRPELQAMTLEAMVRQVRSRDHCPGILQTGRRPGGIPSGACWRRATLTGIRKAAMTRPLRLPVTGRLMRQPVPTGNPPNISKPACGWPDTMVTC